jgi:hypothetical protein
MAHRLVPPARVFRIETLDRERPGRRKIAQTVLVMNRERFARLARDVPRTGRHGKQALPVVRRVLKLPHAAEYHGKGTQRLDSRRRAVAIRHAAVDRVTKRFPRAIVQAGANVYVAERQRFPCVARTSRPPGHQFEQPPGQSGE